MITSNSMTLFEYARIMQEKLTGIELCKLKSISDKFENEKYCWIWLPKEEDMTKLDKIIKDYLTYMQFQIIDKDSIFNKDIFANEYAFPRSSFWLSDAYRDSSGVFNGGDWLHGCCINYKY